MTVGALMHLDYLGLIQMDTIAPFSRINLPKNLTIDYFGEPLSVTFQQDLPTYSLLLGQAVFTQAGAELASLANSQPVEGFIDMAIEFWKKYSVSVERIKQGDQPTSKATLET